ncbi:MAG: hypothetical protein ACUVQR_12680 [Thermogutta sp.]
MMAVCAVFWDLNLIVGDATQLIVALAIIILSILGSLLQSRQEAKKRREKMGKVKGPGRRSEMIEVLLRESASQPASPTPQRPPALPKRPPIIEAEVVPVSVADHVTHTFQTTMAREEVVPGQVGSLVREKTPQTTPERRRRPGKPAELPTAGIGGLPKVTTPTAAPHQISSEVTASESTATAASPMMDGLADMLSSPQGIATAIVLKEILERPESRWR